MPRITIEPAETEAGLRRWTLSERIVTEDLTSDHYAIRLLERLSWATADAEALESRSPRPD
jgi:hypothetical protein